MLSLPWLRRRRRARLRQRPLPPPWVAAIERAVPLYRLLPEEDRRELHGHIQVFLAEKRFEGCRGMVITDAVRLTIAAQACLLLLHRDTDYYPQLEVILVYPGAFEVELEWSVDGHVHASASETRAGESWQQGVVVLSWPDVQEGAADLRDGYNVVLHEFAHQLDQEAGGDDGTPALLAADQRADWARVMSEAYDAHVAAVEGGLSTLIDPYAAESPGEFFAVLTEHFFETPLELARAHPPLYEQLQRFYRQDPAALRVADSGFERCRRDGGGSRRYRGRFPRRRAR